MGATKQKKNQTNPPQQQQQNQKNRQENQTLCVPQTKAFVQRWRAVVIAQLEDLQGNL